MEGIDLLNFATFFPTANLSNGVVKQINLFQTLVDTVNNDVSYSFQFQGPFTSVEYDPNLSVLVDPQGTASMLKSAHNTTMHDTGAGGDGGGGSNVGLIVGLSVGLPVVFGILVVLVIVVALVVGGVMKFRYRHLGASRDSVNL